MSLIPQIPVLTKPRCASLALLGAAFLFVSSPARAQDEGVHYLFVPFCYGGTQDDFDATVNSMMDVYYENYRITDCSEGTEADGRYYFHETVSIDAMPADVDCEELSSGSLREAAREVGIPIDDYDDVWFITDYEGNGCIGGNEAGVLRAWGYPGQEIVFAHEKGHDFGLIDEYLESRVGDPPNGPRPEYGCDPAEGCCDISRECLPFDICLGNLSAAVDEDWYWNDPLPPLNDEGKRCLMSAGGVGEGSQAERHFCPLCLAHLAHNPDVPRCPGQRLPVPIVDAQMSGHLTYVINQECEGPEGTWVELDGSASYDPDDDPITYLWEAEFTTLEDPDLPISGGYFSLGRELATLTVADDDGWAAARVFVDIDDTTPPTITVEPYVSATTCGSGDEVDLPLPQAQDGCFGAADLGGYIYASTDPELEGTSLDPSEIRFLSMGTHWIEWTATDAVGNTATADQVARVMPAIQADGTLRFLDGAQAIDTLGAPAAVANGGDVASYLGVQAKVGDLHSLAPVELRNYALVNGSVYTPSTVFLADGASIAGEVIDTPVELAPLWLPNGVFPPPSGDFFLEPDRSGSLEPGSYNYVAVKSRSTLYLQPGTYYMQAFMLEPQSRVVLTGDEGLVQISVEQWLQHRGVFEGTPQLQLGYAGQWQVFLEAPIQGRLIAPWAEVVVRGDFEGELHAKGIVVDPNRSLICAPLSASTRPEVSCSDGVQNGTESGVDCGGVCPACDDGDPCNFDSDCQSGYCHEGECISIDTCSDGTQNGRETDVDCGGGICPGCGDGMSCETTDDCLPWHTCENLVCELGPIVE